MTDSIWAAIISGTLVLIGVILTVRTKYTERKADQVAVALASQLSGWDTYSKSLRLRITDLENDNTRLSNTITDLREKNDDLESRCEDYQAEVAKLNRENNDLKHLLQQQPKGG